MAKVKVLNANDIAHLLDMSAVINAVEDAYKEKADQSGEIWPMVYHAFGDMADMDIRSGCLKPKNVFGNKLLAWFGDNAKVNKPELNGVVTLYSYSDGFPIAIVNAPALTGFRTGAAGAVASRLLANPSAKDLLMVGAGGQAAYQIMAQLIALPTINHVMVYDPMNSANAQRFVETAKERLITLFSTNIQATLPEQAEAVQKRLAQVSFTAVSDLEAATKDAQVIVTVTPSTKAMIKAAWVQPGTHINAIGADMEGKQEVDSQLYTTARAFVDDREQATTVGETQNPIKDHLITKDQVTEIGDVLIGKATGRQAAQEITIFDSTGIALQDLEAASLALKNAQQFNLGTEVEI